MTCTTLRVSLGHLRGARVDELLLESKARACCKARLLPASSLDPILGLAARRRAPLVLQVGHGQRYGKHKLARNVVRRAEEPLGVALWRRRALLGFCERGLRTRLPVSITTDDLGHGRALFGLFRAVLRLLRLAPCETRPPARFRATQHGFGFLPGRESFEGINGQQRGGLSRAGLVV
jgi:hypothetical protein